jgi:phage FluMu protein Com
LDEKIAYLQGLKEGLGLDESTKEGKMLTAILDVLEDVVDELDALSAEQDELNEYAEAIDEDLGDLEAEVYGEDDYSEDDDEDEDEDLEDWDDENYIEVECPQCHDVVRFASSLLADRDVTKVTCPNCDKVVYLNEHGPDGDED